MSPVPFPNPPDDPEEPDGSGLPPEDWEPGPDDDWKEGPGRPGLSVCLPPEQLTLAGFAQNGEADTMAPGPVLAAVVDAVTGQDGKGLAGCSDDQLMGIISAARRMESRNAWTVMAAMGEYAARHAGRRPADEFAPVELGYLHRARLHPARRRLRPGPHRALGPGRADLRVWACPAMPPASSVQTGRRLAPRSAGTRSPEMACPVRAHLHHHSDRLPGLGRADQRALALT